MPRVVHFEIATDSPERAVQFYSEVFGWKIQKWGGPEDYWLCTTGDAEQPGIDGALMRRSKPGWTTVNTIEVPSLDDSIARIVEAGGKVVSPKETIPGVGDFAYCQDTEGNAFGILQSDTKAG